jgi:hypothetical protein
MLLLIFKFEVSFLEAKSQQTGATMVAPVLASPLRLSVLVFSYGIN